MCNSRSIPCSLDRDRRRAPSCGCRLRKQPATPATRAPVQTVDLVRKGHGRAETNTKPRSPSTPTTKEQQKQSAAHAKPWLASRGAWCGPAAACLPCWWPSPAPSRCGTRRSIRTGPTGYRRAPRPRHRCRRARRPAAEPAAATAAAASGAVASSAASAFAPAAAAASAAASAPRAPAPALAAVAPARAWAALRREHDLFLARNALPLLLTRGRGSGPPTSTPTAAAATQRQRCRGSHSAHGALRTRDVGILHVRDTHF